MGNNNITKKLENFLKSSDNKKENNNEDNKIKVIPNNDGLLDLNEVLNKTVKSSDGRTLLREVTNY
jgi:hypothetical protein